MSDIKRQWNVICDVCGWKYKNHELRKRWDGAMVCKKDWEPRHPQDLIKIPKDDQSVPYARPEASDQFVTVTDNSGSFPTQDTITLTGNFDTNNGTL